MSMNAQAMAVSGYGYGAQLMAVSGYGEVVTEEHQGGIVLNRRRIHEEEEELMQVLAIALPLITRRLKWHK